MGRSKKPAAAVSIAMGLLLPALSAGASTSTDTTGDEELNAWALDYTGGTAGAASGDPIKLGYVNQDALYPEATLGIEAAVEYVNAELGGAAGRPIELVECEVTSAEAAASCGAELANNDEVVAVLTGTINDGNNTLYEALDGNKPLLIGNGVTVDDFVTPAGVSYTAGSPGVVQGLAAFTIEELAPSTVAVVFADNPPGQAAANVLLKPALDEAGVASTLVAVSATATAPDVVSALEAAGVGSADVVVTLLSLTGCIASYDAMASLGISPTVVTTGLCYGTPMSTHLHDVDAAGEFPDGWYFGGYGYSYFEPDYDSGMQTYVAKINQYGEPVEGASTIEYTGFAGPTFANLLTMTRFINELGADSLDFATVDATLREFTGPMMLQAGPIECGIGIFVAVCGHQMGVQQYVDGGWVSVRDALVGDPVDLAPTS